MLPAIVVTLPSAVRSFCGGRSQLEFCAADVGALLRELARLHPAVHVRLCDEGGAPRRHINLFVNDDHIGSLAGLATLLRPGDVVTILPAVSGG